MASLAALEKLVCMIALILVGCGFAKKGLLDDAFRKTASWLVTNLFIVGTIVGSVANVTPTLEREELLWALGAIFLTFLLGGGAGWLLARCLPLNRRERNVAFISILIMNNVFVGFPLVEAIFGPEAIFCASLSNIPFNLLLYTVGVAHLQEGTETGIQWRKIFSVPLLATFVALGLFLFRIPLPSVAVDTLTLLGGATVPLSMLVIGASLSKIPLRETLLDWRAYVVSLTRLLVCPLLAFLLGGLLPIDPATLGVYIVTAACPSGAMVTILCIQFGADDRFASKINFLSTTLCALTLPVVVHFLL